MFKITSTPGYNKTHGQHPTELVFLLSGPHGVIQWRFSTGLSPLGNWPSADTYGPLCMDCNLSPPQGMGVASHSELTEANAHEEDYNITEGCEYLEGRTCVCDYSRAIDSDLTSAFACEGIPGVERILTKIYTEHYGEAP